MMGLVLAPAMSFAQSQERRIFIYPTRSSASFTAQVGSGNCRISLGETQGARVVGETATHLQVVFDTDDLHGCYGDQWLQGHDLKRGWLAKSEISYADAENNEWKAAPSPTAQAEDCPPPAQAPVDGKTYRNLDDLIGTIKREHSGMKSPEEVENYLRCYPKSADGLANSRTFKPVMDRIASTFSLRSGANTLKVDPTLFRCLLRRESGYDPKTVSSTGAAGLGQHTDINIRHIANRLKSPNSWESKLWKDFFRDIRKTEDGRKMLAACPGSRRGEIPRFETKADASCPLQSMAASAIYNLQIQQALMRSSNVRNIEWENELDYQLAIGAAYNLGDGASAKAVDDLVVDGWLDSIRRKSPDKDKRAEVDNHIKALRNCLQAGNWDPMYKKDQPQCADFARVSAAGRPAGSESAPRPSAGAQ